jgi:hypothetical protein
MTNLYALCRPSEQLEVKRVRLTQSVQDKIEGIFQAQASAFLDGIEEEVEFGGEWKPDSDELLTMELPEEADLIMSTVAASPMSLSHIDADNFMAEGIKGLLTTRQNGGSTQVLIQSFSAQQILARRFSLWLDGDTFKEITAPAFTLDNYITAIIEDGKLKFKSFFQVKRIFALSQFYQAATDQQIEAFCSHSSLHVPDVSAFKATADESIRKKVHAIVKTRVLDNYPVSEIVTKAGALGLAITTDNGKLVVPSTRKEIKTLFRFLDDGIYEAALSSARYITNSKRPFT